MRTQLQLPLAMVLLMGCSQASYGNRETGPTLSLPVRLAEGSDQDAGAPPPAGGDAEAPPDAAAAWPSPPDPEPLRMAEQWEYELLYSAGEISVQRVTPLRLRQPAVTGRYMGRFAFELWIGHELIERVRFDFPLLAAEPAPSVGPARPLHEAPRLDRGAVVSRRIRVPASPRATRAVILDRATGEVIELPWPPDQPQALAPPPTSPDSADAGLPDAG
ncbi:MAG TPA: hypothetical protein VKZ49_07580 [Polyangiaceae bacterium]|nr:hypothetical protein [Polyangiaceae bacterium]